MKLHDDTKEIIIHIVVILVAIAIIVPIGFFAYKHRVVEKKQYSVIGVITDKEHIEAYTTVRYDPATKTVKTTMHPEKFYIYYSVTFENATYSGNCEKVNRSQYNDLKAGSEISCIFEKQWRADGSETYDIWAVR